MKLGNNIANIVPKGAGASLRANPQGQPPSQPQGNGWNWDKIIIGVLVIVILFVTLVVVLESRKPQFIELDSPTTFRDSQTTFVKLGDIVTVNYVLSYSNGTIIDTTLKEVAEANNIYDPNKRYTPVTIHVGSKEIIRGLNSAIIGMRQGEGKEVEIPIGKAYGFRDPGLIEVIPRIQPSPRIQTSTKEKFIEAIGVEPKIGLRVRPPELGWDIVVLNVTSNMVEFRNDPSSKVKLNTAFGKADVRVTEDEIQIILPEPSVGTKVNTGYGTGRVTYVNDSSIVLDFNYELADKILKYFIKIEAINSPNQDPGLDNVTVTLKYFWSATCGYCKIQDPILHEFLEEHPTLKFVLIDIRRPESMKEMVKYKTFGTPSFILKKGDTELKLGGLQTKKQLMDFICPKLQDEMCLTGESEEKGNVTKWW